jgi:hypothetical protein
MKNIHIIPTDKPSRLAKHSSGSFHIVSYIAHKKGLYKITNQHIYITSDEEIKEVDWVIECSLNWVFKMHKHGLPNYNPNKKKIILTTDPNLIKDGVQAIDDEFLEWFIKNPSCEFVEVEESSYQKKLKKPIYKGLGVYRYDETIYFLKIMIPKEEVLVSKDVNCLTCGLSFNTTYNNNTGDYSNVYCSEDCYKTQEKPKQETLEEVEENIDREEWINFFKNNSKEEILEYLINYKFPL